MKNILQTQKLISYTNKQQLAGSFRSLSIHLLELSLVSLMTMGSLQAQETQKDKGKALMETTHQTITQEKHHFEPNKGQIADHEGNVLSELEYVYQAPGMKLGLTQNGFHYNLYTVQEKQQISEATGKPAQNPKRKLKEEADQHNLTYHYHRVEVNFKGANEDPEIIAEQKTDYYANYYLAHCPEGITNVHGYRKLTYKNLYDNIDLVLTPQQNEQGKPSLKYNIRVRPGGDLSDVKMAYKGMDGLSLKDGQLTIKTSEGKLKESIPASFWAGSRKGVEVDYQAKGNVVSFEAETGKARRQETLVVDPSLSWSTYLGEGELEEARGLTTDVNGNVYVTGFAQSGFPTTSGSYQSSHSGLVDVFLSHFKGSGSLSWSTYLGGSVDEFGNDVTTDGSGNVYVTGEALYDFPTTSGAYQESFGGGGGFIEDAFLSKFTSNGNLTWSTYLGGSNNEGGTDVATDGSGNVYVTGYAESGFPTTSGAYQESHGGDNDAFLSKFSSGGSLSWSTYLGGSGYDYANGLTTNGNGNVYVTGQADSTDFPTTNGAYQESYGGNGDAFLSKFTKSGSLSWSTYLGGEYGESANGVTTDGSDNVYVTGDVDSIDFPTTNGAYQKSFGGGNQFRGDAFLSKFTGSGNLSWSTYLGGRYGESASDLTTDSSKNVYVTGDADTTFPATKGAYQRCPGSRSFDAFLSKFSSSGSLNWSTYLGGGYRESAKGVTTDGSGNVYVTGQADSTDFPTANGAYQQSYGGNGDAFLSKFDTLAITDSCSPKNRTISPTACQSYITPDGQRTLRSSGTYKDTLENASANCCDSIITINLTINDVDSSAKQSGGTLEANASEATYQWLDCDNGYAEISGATSQSFTPSADGNYAVAVTKNNCTDTSSCYQVQTTGIKSNGSKTGFEVYPNPAADQLTIVQQGNLKPQTFQLQTLTGQRLKTSQLSGTERIDVSTLSPGVYLLEVQGEDAVRTKRVVVK